MNLRFQGISGTVYYVHEKKIAGGGEGAIHEIENNTTQVAKIFREDKRTPQREEKLKLMVRHKMSPQQLEQITWPQDVIYDQNGFVGYIMPRLHASSSLSEVYSGSEYDLRFRLLTAINLCAAVDTVHSMGQVCGDLNPQNICVNLNKNDRDNGFKVTLVDTDSYHFSADGNTYRCEVGLGDYIAPELQQKMKNGADLRSISLPTYTRETDLFALAVHIFCLLMNGCHPFACSKDTSLNMANIAQMTGQACVDSVVAPQPIENIVNGFFPFYHSQQGIQIPLYAPKFDSLPITLQNLFIRTFVDGYQNPEMRVSATEWITAMQPLLSTIEKCKEKGHYYFGHVESCPLCEVENRISRIISGGEIKEEEPPLPPSPPPQIIKPNKGNKVVATLLYTCAILGLLICIAFYDRHSHIPENYYQEDLYEKTPSPATEQVVQNFEMFGIQIEAPAGWKLHEVDDEWISGDYDEDTRISIRKDKSPFSATKKSTQKPTKRMWNYYEEYSFYDSALSQKRIKLGKMWFIKQKYKDCGDYTYKYILNEHGLEYEFKLYSYGKKVSGEKVKEFEKALSTLKI